MRFLNDNRFVDIIYIYVPRFINLGFFPFDSDEFVIDTWQKSCFNNYILNDF